MVEAVHMARAQNGMVDWKTLFVGVEEQVLDYCPSMLQKGLVKPSSDILDEGIAEWKCSLVGQFIGDAPNFNAMQKLAEMMWGKMYNVKVSLAGANLYVFSFANATVRDWF
ncbi:hypothetical protein V6N13_102358 [Hibiscus sabdariffa]